MNTFNQHQNSTSIIDRKIRNRYRPYRYCGIIQIWCHEFTCKHQKKAFLCSLKLCIINFSQIILNITINQNMYVCHSQTGYINYRNSPVSPINIQYDTTISESPCLNLRFQQITLQRRTLLLHGINREI